MTATPLLDVRDLTRRFGGLVAVDGLDLSVQAVRQILDVQGSHKFLQNAPSMEEGKLSVKQLHQRLARGRL